ncbi:MAG: UvrD-helicase domain-containing protein [Xanthomonadales bacterium]|nr:UvrD-helicase domain-containing protein [Xanthomonadales bacterium]
MSTLTDWRELDLDLEHAAHRRILVEASAGTGKTWTISVLYLRLIVEHGLRPGAIVVSTFTDAAAAELRERIRARLQWALRQGGAPTTAPEEAELRAWLIASRASVPLAEAQWRLQRALAELERAPIATLHALCRRILDEQALSAGTALRPGELVADAELRSELLDDLTRWLAHGAGDDEASGLPALARMNPAARAKLLQAAMQPGVVVVGGEVTELLALFEDRDWPTRLREFAATLAMQPRKRALRSRLGELADWLECGAPFADFEGKLKDLADDAYWREQLHPDHLASSLADPAATFAREAGALLRHRDAILCAAGVRRVLPMLEAWREARLAAREQFTFDDLISRVHARATAPRADGEHLADRLHAQWPVSLIDEFQDTDARQWAIFDALHRDPAGASRGLLLLIGDPKQAIYGFRGSDIASYLRAAASTTQRLTLAVNQRASAGLVAATNALYGASASPFAMDDDAIHYLPVRASGRADDKPLLRSDGAAFAPMQLHAPDADPLGTCVELIAHYLVPGRWTLGERALGPGDLAVLLPRHDHIVELRERLARRRIPCVGAGRSDLFASTWADELRVVLHALSQPTDAGALRAALATRLLGEDYASLRACAADDARWRQRVEVLLRWAEAWQRHGVLHAVDRIIAFAAPRLLARIDGERALTDLRHLGELLQTREQRSQGRQQLLSWFAQQCEAPAAGAEAAAKERALRIESDSGRVQLLTLHASKGLEFPVVLLPLMHAQRAAGRDWPQWTDAASGERRIDLGSRHSDAHRALAERESLQERTRLLYVALTRAQHACHLVLPESSATRDERESALHWLLHRVDLAALTADGAQIALHTTRPERAPEPPATTAAARRSVRPGPARRRIEAAYSFSSLMARAAVADRNEAAARDEHLEQALAVADTAAPAEPRLAALSPWRGAELGNAMHAVFEQREIGRPLAEQRVLVQEQLARAGLAVDGARGSALVDAVIERAQATLAADLGGGLRLGDLDARAQRAEMGFQFRIEQLDLLRLRALCEQCGESGLVPAGLGGGALHGFLGGKIDLVLVHGGAVHVLDYKSNHLGDALADYQGEALALAMDAHGYRWQALLYALAVQRYLARRQRGQHAALALGDTIYLFVRALGMAPDAGIWRHRFAPEFLAAVDALFAAAEMEIA